MVVKDGMKPYSHQLVKPYDVIVYKKDGRVYAVDRYGKVVAKGVDGTDDTTVIQAAINASTTSTLVKNGSYTINATLTIQKTGYIINFDNSLLTAGTGIGSINRVVNEGPTYNQSVIMVWKSSRVIVENARVDCNNRPGSCGILVYGQGQLSGTYLNEHITVRNCECFNAVEYPKTPPTTSTNGYGIFVCGSINTIVDSCYVHDNPIGIFVYGYIYSGGNWNRHNTIINCKCYNNFVKYVKYFGLGIYGYYDPGLHVTNCTIHGDHRVGIWLGEGSSDKDLHYIVENCTVSGCYHNGIHLAGNAKRSIISKCTVSNCKSIGIASGPNSVVSECVCYDNGGGLPGKLLPAPDLEKGAGIYNYGVSTVTYHNNICYDSGGNIQRYGIFDLDIYGPRTNILHNNNLSGCEVPYISYEYSPGNVIKCNITASTTLLPSSVNNIETTNFVTLTLPKYSPRNDIIQIRAYSNSANSRYIYIQPYDTTDRLIYKGKVVPSLYMAYNGTLELVNTNMRWKIYRNGASDNLITTTNDNGGTVNWTNPSKITGHDDDYTTASSSANAKTYRLVRKRNMAIPSDATVLGIVVSMERIASHSDSNNYVVDDEVRLIKADGSYSSSNLASGDKWETGWYDVSCGLTKRMVYGSTTELWGETWTSSDINSSNFGVAVSANIVSDGTNVTASIDTLGINVVYEYGSNIWVVRNYDAGVTE